MQRGDVHFAWTDDVAIAYEVVGEGAIDLVYLPPFQSNLDWHWEFEPHARFLKRLASFTRLIVIDRRGWGCSDRVTPGSFPPLEVAADDVITVLDAVGSSRSAVFAGAEGAWAAMIAAATNPDRFSALVLYQAEATSLYTEETPWNYTEEQVREAAEYWHNAGTRTFWEEWIRGNAPSLSGDADAIDWFTKIARGTIGLGGAQAEFARYMSTDVQGILPTIRVPTLVLFKPDNETAPPEAGPYLASKIPGARLVALPGADYLPWSDEPDALLGEVEEFLTGIRSVPESDRVLATVLFTDIVGSTEKAAEIGDAYWKGLLKHHHEHVRRQLAAHRGVERDTAGDGFFATFDGPARAVRCALAIGSALRELGLEIRAGVHTGEVELTDEGVQGIAVHIGARVAAIAGPSEVLASSTVKDLVAGSGLVFEDAGEHELKGVPDRWHLYRVLK